MQYLIYEDDIIMQHYLHLFFYCCVFVTRYFVLLVMGCSLFCLFMQNRSYEDAVILQQQLHLFFYCWLLIAIYLFIVCYVLIFILFIEAVPQIV